MKSVIKPFLSFIAIENSSLADLRNELSKEQDSRQKLEQDILELRRVRSTMNRHSLRIKLESLLLDVLLKKLKRLNRSASTGNCSNSKGDTKSN